MRLACPASVTRIANNAKPVSRTGKSSSQRTHSPFASTSVEVILVVSLTDSPGLVAGTDTPWYTGPIAIQSPVPEAKAWATHADIAVTLVRFSIGVGFRRLPLVDTLGIRSVWSRQWVPGMAWSQTYNRVRPHSSLGCRPPAPETLLCLLTLCRGTTIGGRSGVRRNGSGGRSTPERGGLSRRRGPLVACHASVKR